MHKVTVMNMLRIGHVGSAGKARCRANDDLSAPWDRQRMASGASPSGSIVEPGKSPRGSGPVRSS